MAAGAQASGWNGPSRRRFPRFQVQAPLDVTVLRSGIPDTVPGRSVNVSERGFAAVMAGELAPGETVGVELRLPRVSDPVQARAQVKYQDKLRCGLEFVGLTAAQQAAIRDWSKEARAEAEMSVSAAPAPEVGKLEAEAKTKKPESKSVDGAETKKAESPPAKEAAKAKMRAGVSARPGPVKKRRRFAPWIIILLLLLFWSAVAAAIFWWRWSRGWAALESPMGSEVTMTVEKPQAQVSAEVMEKLVIHRVEPVYPAEARQQNLQGIIALDILVGRDGSVAKMRALNGPEVLARAAMDALRWWKFEPYRINGEPAVIETTVAVEFKR